MDSLDTESLGDEKEENIEQEGQREIHFNIMQYRKEGMKKERTTSIMMMMQKGRKSLLP
jgi:hypothetical protein